MATTPRETPATLRRKEDLATYALGRGVLWIAKHWKAIAAGVVAVVSFGTGAAAWLGAQSATGPGARIEQLEIKVDSGLAEVNLRIDSLTERMARQDSIRTERERASDMDMDFLIRLGCRSMKDADLMRQCDRRGAR